MRVRLLAAAAIAAAALLLPARAHAQWAADDPAQPRDPREMRVCDSMAAEWRALISANREQHQSCLTANERGKSCKASAVEGATCSCPACEALHVEMQSLPRRMNAAVSACREKVRAFEKEQRRREEEERKRKAEEERRQREAERKRKEEEDARKRAEEAAAREQAEADRIREEETHDRDRDRERQDALRAAEQEHARRQEADRLEREAAEREERRREQMDRDQRALKGAAEMTQIQEQLLARRQAERAAYVEQLEQQQLRRQEAARQEQGAAASGLAEAFAGVKDALRGTTEEKASGDLLGGFDIPSAGAPDPALSAINRLLDHGKERVPFAAIPFELIRSSVTETLAAPDRIFNAIGDMENSDPRMLDAVVTGFNERVIGPRNFARILTEHWVKGVKDQAQGFTRTRLTEPATREAQRRMGEAFRTRNPRALFEPRRTGLPNVRVHGWWTEQSTGRMRTVTDDRGVPMLIDRSGRLFRFDPSRNAAQYTAEEVPALIARHGLRVARVGETEFRQEAIILSPIMREEDAVVDIVALLQKGWAAGELVGAALAAGERK